MKIEPKALALSTGILFAIIALVLGIWFSLTGFGESIVKMLQEIYANLLSLGYDINLKAGQNLIRNMGSLLMLTAFSFVDGVIAGLILSFFYNLFIPAENKK